MRSQKIDLEIAVHVRLKAYCKERDISMKDFASAILTDAMDRGDSGCSVAGTGDEGG